MSKHTYSVDDNKFIDSIQPLYRQRRLYLIIGIACLIILPSGTIASLIAIPVGIFALFRNARAASAIDSIAMKTFSANLEPIQSNHCKQPTPLIGALGSLGNHRSLLELTRGRLHDCEVAVYTYIVNWKPRRNNSSYFKTYRVLELTVNRNFHHVFVDSVHNSRLFGPSSMYILSKSLRKNPTLSVEGDVHKYFRIYVPPGSEREGLITLSPDKLLALREFGTHFDIEFVENKIYLISRLSIRKPEDILMYTSAAINLITSIGQNIARERTIPAKELRVDEPFVITY